MPTISQLIRKPRQQKPPTATRPGLEGLPQKRGVHARLHDDPEEAELGAP